MGEKPLQFIVSIGKKKQDTC